MLRYIVILFLATVLELMECKVRNNGNGMECMYFRLQKELRRLRDEKP